METLRDLEKTKIRSQEGRGSSSRSQERSWRDGHHLHSGGGGYYGGGGGSGRARRSGDDVHTIRLAMVKIDCNMALPLKSAGGTLAPELLTRRCPKITPWLCNIFASNQVIGQRAIVSPHRSYL